MPLPTGPGPDPFSTSLPLPETRPLPLRMARSPGDTHWIGKPPHHGGGRASEAPRAVLWAGWPGDPSLIVWAPTAAGTSWQAMLSAVAWSPPFQRPPLTSSIPRAPGLKVLLSELLQGRRMEHPRGSEKAWAGHLPLYLAHANRGLRWASYRGQAGQARHSGGFAGLWGQRAQALKGGQTSPPASCCQGGKSLGFQSFWLFRRRTSMFVHRMPQN